MLHALQMVVILALAAAAPLPAQKEAAPLPAQEGIARDTWVKRMQERLPAHLCRAAYFRECFEVKKEECLAKANDSVAGCLSKDRALLPANLTIQNGQEWGAKIGTCTGVTLEKALAPKKKPDAKCYDAKLWIGK